MAQTLKDGVYQVIIDRFVAGFVVEEGKIKALAPILRWKSRAWLFQHATLIKARML